MSAALAAAEQVKPEPSLTPRQKAFADAYAAALVAGTAFTQAELAQAAGYSGSKEVLEVLGSRCLANPRVIEYLQTLARQHLKAGAMDAAITLRRLSTRAKSERVRADVASRLATGLGLIEGEQGRSGPGVVLNLILAPEFGALLTQPTGQVLEHQHQQAPSTVAHSLTEGATPASDPDEGEGVP